MPALRPSKYIWHNGELIHWGEAKVHIGIHALHYASTVFEGIRCYDTECGSAVFRLEDHIRRLIDSAKIHRMPLEYAAPDLGEACLETIRGNEMGSCYVRPIIFRGYGWLGVNPSPCPVEAYVMVWEWGRYLGDEAIENGVDVKISTWNRLAPNTLPSMAKAGGNYLSSQLIKMEAEADGYAEGIALDSNGYVSEGSGENVFLVRDGTLYTPPLHAAVLPGITRNTVMTLAHDLGYVVKEENLPREALYIADELFFTGTAAEITPIRSVDRLVVGSGTRGPITEAIQSCFFDLVEGRSENPRGWLTPVYVSSESKVVAGTEKSIA